VILEVVDGGLLTTVQDGGRPETTHLGVPAGGAADRWSLAVANLLLDNEPSAAALEMTVIGPRLIVREPGTIGLGGADLGARTAVGRRLEAGRSHRLEAGDELVFEGAASTATGIRGYLALPGRVDVPVVLGSRSTCLPGGFGGVDGRSLRAGDIVRSGATARRSTGVTGRGPGEMAWPTADVISATADPDVAILRIVAGRSGPDAVRALTEREWQVSPGVDRVGVRLVGATLPADIAGEAVTHGVPWGAIQVPADGSPIILSVDHQTTGGYRVAAVVIAADLPILGQLGPGRAVRLAETTLDAADAALRDQRAMLRAGAAALRDARSWEDLASSAGG